MQWITFARVQIAWVGVQLECMFRDVIMHESCSFAHELDPSGLLRDTLLCRIVFGARHACWDAAAAGHGIANWPCWKTGKHPAPHLELMVWA